MVSQENYRLDESSFRHIHCLDNLDGAIFQAEICLLEICRRLKRKFTDFDVFDEVSFLIQLVRPRDTDSGRGGNKITGYFFL